MTGRARVPGRSLLTGKEGTGISWPGVSLTYAMVDTEGQTVSAAYTQQSRTSHKSLLLPYALFGLGRSPNFVETMNIGVPQFPGAHQTWQQ
uniref:T-cell immunomodulatory protein TIP C2 domain-containing protein n=1 Tax=Romanomermis culicivorax TaxID=13658 RepID=A0A915IXI5_ROMCU